MVKSITERRKMNRLLHSGKFWTAIVDALISTLGIVLTWFLAPDKVTQVLTLIGMWQPVIAIVIASYAYEDAKKIEMGILPNPPIK